MFMKEQTIRNRAARCLLLIMSNLRYGCPMFVEKSGFRLAPPFTTHMLSRDSGNRRSLCASFLMVFWERFVNTPLPPTSSHSFLLRLPIKSPLYSDCCDIQRVVICFSPFIWRELYSRPVVPIATTAERASFLTLIVSTVSASLNAAFHFFHRYDRPQLVRAISQ